MSSYKSCTEVSPQCPVEATTYGYRPVLGINTTLLVIFALCTMSQIVIGVRYRIRAFTSVTAFGCLLETLGYAGRLMMNRNPWSSGGFRMQIICLILGPSFLAAGIYLTLKHLVIYFGSEKSRLAPQLYPIVFISCDAISIVAQAAGGGLAASGTGKLLDIGNNIIIAGIAFQVATMAVCFALAVDFFVRLHKAGGTRKDLGRGFSIYLFATALSFITILIRCIYRLPEMAGGWGSQLQRHEPEFLALDGLMIVIAAVLMTVVHPAFFFPDISSGNQIRSTHMTKHDKPDELELRRKHMRLQSSETPGRVNT